MVGPSLGGVDTLAFTPTYRFSTVAYALTENVPIPFTFTGTAVKLT